MKVWGFRPPKSEKLKKNYPMPPEGWGVQKRFKKLSKNAHASSNSKSTDLWCSPQSRQGRDKYKNTCKMCHSYKEI